VYLSCRRKDSGGGRNRGFPIAFIGQTSPPEIALVGAWFFVAAECGVAVFAMIVETMPSAIMLGDAWRRYRSVGPTIWAFPASDLDGGGRMGR
jgi:hypothetical protein